MATTPINVVTKDLLPEALLEELSEPTVKAEELIAELKGWSECNPNPDDPDAKTMRDVFDELIQDPAIIAALQALRSARPSGVMDSRAWTRLFFNADETPAWHSNVRLQGFAVDNEQAWPDHLYIGATALKILNFYEYERGGDPQWLGLERLSNNMLRVTQDGEYAFTGTFQVDLKAHFSDEEVLAQGWTMSNASPVLLERFEGLNDNTQLAFRSVNFNLSAFIFRQGNAAGPGEQIAFRPVVPSDSPMDPDPIQYPYHSATEGGLGFSYTRAQARKRLAFGFDQRLYLRAGDEIFFRLQRSQPILRYGDRVDSLQFAKITDAFAANPNRDTTNFIQITRLSDPPSTEEEPEPTNTPTP